MLNAVFDRHRCLHGGHAHNCCLLGGVVGKKKCAGLLLAFVAVDTDLDLFRTTIWTSGFVAYQILMMCAASLMMCAIVLMQDVADFLSA